MRRHAYDFGPRTIDLYSQRIPDVAFQFHLATYDGHER